MADASGRYPPAFLEFAREVRDIRDLTADNETTWVRRDPRKLIEALASKSDSKFCHVAQGILKALDDGDHWDAVETAFALGSLVSEDELAAALTRWLPRIKRDIERDHQRLSDFSKATQERHALRPRSDNEAVVKAVAVLHKAKPELTYTEASDQVGKREGRTGRAIRDIVKRTQPWIAWKAPRRGRRKGKR